ncbi:hypothetical protein B296_00017275 [Ensete ventricosum]|uniref:Transposase (putative) gypsy type domain-containing protein n=1 Tax=Ensete ventricosum TaxID=4639 RepID=A0A426ZUR2_ENSVE|nr:hypothetical protein B296_00017275 [Ensete ventricosum]
MDGAPVSYPRGRLLEWWSSGREEAPLLGSSVGSCKEVGSGKFRRDPSDGQVSSVVDFSIPLPRRGAGAFIMSVVGPLYLVTLLPLRLTMSLYLSTMPLVLAVRRAFAVRSVDLTYVRSAIRPLTPPILTFDRLPTSGRPRRRASSWGLGKLNSRVNSGTNLGDLAERVNSGTNPRDLAERVNSSVNPGDLAERVNWRINLGDLAEWVNSGINSRDLAERVNSGTNRGDLAERVNSGTNPGDLAERVNSDMNLRDFAERVMKSDHDLDTAVTEGSLAVIREWYSIPVEYGLHVPQPEQRPYSLDAPGMCISVDALEVGLQFPLHPLIEECLRWLRISPSQGAPNSWRYLVVFLGECRGARIILTRDLFMACFRLCKSRGGYYLTARVGFRVSGAPSNNKGWKSCYLFVSDPVWGFRLD